MLKRIIDHILAGLGIAFIITNITMYIFLRDITGEQAILSSTIWMCAGVFYGLISLIHDTNINKALAALIHYAFNLALSLGAFLLMYNVVLKQEIGFSLLWPICVFTLVYMFIGIGNFVYSKISVNELNKKLKEDN